MGSYNPLWAPVEDTNKISSKYITSTASQMCHNSAILIQTTNASLKEYPLFDLQEKKGTLSQVQEQNPLVA